MSCTNCGNENARSARFCDQCGAALERRCGGCGEVLSARARFCSACGHAADEGAQGQSRGPSHGGPGVAERRPLTVLFCDVVGFTRLGQQLDPEDLSEVLRGYQQACRAGIESYDGHIAQYLGDGVLAYFGYPQAHEDDSERAVRAALHIQDLLRRASAAADVPIEARIGIHSGPVLMSEVGNDEGAQTLALGDTANIASRLEGIAPPGGIVISAETLSQLRGGFVTHELGLQTLKGVEQPILAHEIEGTADAARAPRITADLPMAGRDPERDRFLECWGQARAGRGQVIGISGEAGIGKSRLLQACRAAVGEPPYTWLEVYCSPYAKGSPFQPLIDALARSLGFERDEPGQSKLAKLETALGLLDGLRLERVVPYIGPLLSLPPSDRYPPESASEEVLRERTLQAVLEILLTTAAQQPVVLTCEDLHWCDPSTLELLGALIDAAPDAGLLLLLTWRPEFEPGWAETAMSRVELRRLGDAEAREVVANVAAGRTIPEALLEEIVARADGVPLFAEELAKSVLEGGLLSEGGTGDLGWSADFVVPSTLQASLMARLDRLSSAKMIAQVAATIGRDFSYDLIEAVAGLDASALRAALAQLVDAEILFEQGTPPESTYSFKHALLQDTAYESQLRSKRRELHAQIAETLETQYPERAAAEPQVVARHASLGRQHDRAVRHYQQAGQLAIARLAKPEAAEHFRRALEALEALPADEARDLREVDLRLAMLNPLSEKGYEDAAVLEQGTRLEALAEKIPHGPARIPVLFGLARFAQASGDLPRAGVFTSSLLEIVEPIGMPIVEAACHLILGSLAICVSTVAEARYHLQRAYDITEGGTAVPPSGPLELELGAVALSTYAVALVLDGEPDKAREAVAGSTARAGAVEHVYGKASHMNAADTAFFLDDPVTAGEIAGTCLALVEGLGFHLVESIGLVYRGWSRVCAGDFGGTVDAKDGIDLAVASGSRGGIIQHFLVAAETFSRAGDYDTALQYVDGAEEWIEKTGERAAFTYQVAMYRAEILMDSGSSELERARELLLEASRLLRAYGAPWYQLRIAISLARLGVQGVEPRAARLQLEAAIAALPGCSAEPRVQIARQLLLDLPPG